jgi:dihydroneopterin aldolase
MEKNIIFVKNFITYCLIGVYPEEKKNKQKIKISVKLNIKRRITSDKLSSTVCYQNILNSLENIHKYGHIKLVETLANKLAEEFQKINDVTKIKIKIVKCDISKKNTDVGFILKKNIKKL